MALSEEKTTKPSANWDEYTKRRVRADQLLREYCSTFKKQYGHPLNLEEQKELIAWLEAR